MDSVSGTYFAQAREYCSTRGSFISKDNENFISPISIKTFNLYIYCRNNPYTFVDPMGFDPQEGGNSTPFWGFDAMDYFDESNFYGYTLSGLEIMNAGGEYWLINGVRNAQRPANIGRGIWARQIAGEVDDIARASSNFSKGLNALGYAGLVYEVGANAYDNIENGAPVKKVVSDATVDVTISGSAMIVAGGFGTIAGTALAGTAAGSVVPGIGNIVGG